MLPVTERERELVREKMIQVLTEYLTKQGKPAQKSRIQDLSSKFEHQVYQSASTREDYIRAIQEKLKQVHKKATEVSSMDQRGISPQPGILGPAHTSPAPQKVHQPAPQNYPIPPTYSISSLSPQEYQLLHQQVSSLKHFMPQSDKVFSTYQSMGGTLSPDTHRKLGILRNVLIKQMQEFPSGFYTVHPLRFEKLVEYFKNYTSLLSQRITKMETVSNVNLAAEDVSASPFATSDQDEVDFIMNLTIFGVTPHRPSSLATMDQDNQISAISGYLTQQYDFATQLQCIEGDQSTLDPKNPLMISGIVPSSPTDASNGGLSIDSKATSIARNAKISHLEARLLQSQLPLAMNSWVHEVCNLLKQGFYMLEVDSDVKGEKLILMSHKQSSDIARISLPNIETYIKRGQKVAHWKISAEGSGISITEIAEKLFHVSQEQPSCLLKP